MPKNIKNVTVKPKKEKLSPERRSEIAKERWAKRKAQETQQNVSSVSDKLPVALDTLLDEAVANATEGADRVDLLTEQGTILATREIQPPVEVPAPHEVKMIEMELRRAKERDDELVSSMRNATPAPQLAPVAPKRKKGPPVPKEFLVALKTADTRLAKAIEEFEDCQQRIAYLSGAIPRLQRTVLALRNESNPDATIPPYNFPGGAQAYTSAPTPPYYSALDTIHNAQPSPPVSRAQGGVQFSPEMVGTLEGPEDDDEDRYLRGGGIATEGKWL